MRRILLSLVLCLGLLFATPVLAGNTETPGLDGNTETPGAAPEGFTWFLTEGVWYLYFI